MDKRVPVCKLVGCYSWSSHFRGFSFFSPRYSPQDGDVFFYNRGVLCVMVVRRGK